MAEPRETASPRVESTIKIFSSHPVLNQQEADQYRSIDRDLHDVNINTSRGYEIAIDNVGRHQALLSKMITDGDEHEFALALRLIRDTVRNYRHLQELRLGNRVQSYDVPGFILDFVASHAERMGQATNDNSDVEMFSWLTKSGNESQKRVGFESLERKFVSTDDPYSKTTLLEPILSYEATADQSGAVTRSYQLINDTLNNDVLPTEEKLEIMGLLLSVMRNTTDEISQVLLFALARKVNDYGLDLFNDKLIDSWFSGRNINELSYKTPKGYFPGSDVNISRMMTLELEHPGSTKVLTHEFGIKQYSRYSKELLARQFEEYEDTDIPYGVALSPVSDWNAAFYTSGRSINELSNQLGGKYQLRVLEAENKYELIKLLLKLDRRYGARQKIAFAILGGHGTAESIRFGGPNDVLLAADLAKASINTRTSALFVPGATIVLYSCSTGQEGGIGQTLSKALAAKVVSPAKEAYVSNLTPAISEDGIDLDVTYFSISNHSTVEKRIYKNGELVK